MIKTSPIFAKSLSTMDWARSLALAHPKLATFLLQPSSCIWPWLWHQVWHLKTRRRSYKDAVMSRWAAKASASARAPHGTRRLCKNMAFDIRNIEAKIKKQHRMIAEREALLLQLHSRLLKAKGKFKQFTTENTENEFYLRLGHTMLPPNEQDKIIAKKHATKEQAKIRKEKKKNHKEDKEDAAVGSRTQSLSWSTSFWRTISD